MITPFLFQGLNTALPLLTFLPISSHHQLLWWSILNQTPWGGAGGQYDNAESYTIGGGGEPRAGDTYGVAGTPVPRYVGGWFPDVSLLCYLVVGWLIR